MEWSSKVDDFQINELILVFYFIYIFIFYVYWFTGNDPANEPIALRLILRGSPGPTA